MSVVSAVGMMSGTSLDGVDIALIETDGEEIAGFGPIGYRPYSTSERILLRTALATAATLTNRRERPAVLVDAEAMVTRAHGEALEKFLDANSLRRQDIAIVGFHGQTVLHRPAQQLTIQIGNGPALAKRIGIPVAYDFRAADVAAGGQGAPLVPIYHCALVGMQAANGPTAVVNIGGVANISYCRHGELPIACDTGPGNALIDDFVRQHSDKAFDEDGALAAVGKVEGGVVARALGNSYFDQLPPKSLDRNDFADVLSEVGSFSLADGAATLTMLTAASIARVVPNLPSTPGRFIVAGGGSHNRTLMTLLDELLAPATVTTADAVGWSADALEAQAFAYLAVRSQRGLPITFPGTTGVARPMTGGVTATP